MSDTNGSCLLNALVFQKTSVRQRISAKTFSSNYYLNSQPLMGVQNFQHGCMHLRTIIVLIITIGIGMEDSKMNLLILIN